MVKYDFVFFGDIINNVGWICFSKFNKDLNELRKFEV